MASFVFLSSSSASASEGVRGAGDGPRTESAPGTGALGTANSGAGAEAERKKPAGHGGDELFGGICFSFRMRRIVNMACGGIEYPDTVTSARLAKLRELWAF